MKDIDFAGLNSTIEDFEKTVGALERINDISRQTTETAAKIDALCKLLTDTSSWSGFSAVCNGTAIGAG